MRKSVSRTLMAFAVAGMLSMPAFAADYSAMSNAELSALRGTLRTASAQERNAFRHEWQKRIRSMTPEEAQRYRGRPANAPADGQGYRNRNAKSAGNGACDGSGRQNGHARHGQGGRGRRF